MGLSTRFIEVKSATQRIKNFGMEATSWSDGLNTKREKPISAEITDHENPIVILKYKNGKFAEFETVK